MAINQHKHNDNKTKDDIEVNEEEEEEEEEDYIDMEVGSFTNFFPKEILSFPSPKQVREFEFHMSSSINVVDRDSLASPADELFYKGKLLPLHLPPRLEMVEKLLLDSPSSSRFSSRFNKFNNEVYETPLSTNVTTTPIENTPFESCNVSPVESCRVSREIKPDEYFREKGFVFSSSETCPKMSWGKKLKNKIGKIKSLFGKPGCSDEINELQGKETKPSIVSKEKIESKEGNNNVCHRRSFSDAFKRRALTTIKLSSSSSSSSSSTSSMVSSNSSSLSELLFKRSSSVDSEIETSLIQGAIAHCKLSQHTSRSRKTLSEVGCHSFPSRFVSFDDQSSTTQLCRG